MKRKSHKIFDEWTHVGLWRVIQGIKKINAMRDNENMQGKRHDRPDDSIFESGEYGKISNGQWYCCPPDTDLIGNLSKHNVTEHDDGTITVSPSILIRHWSGKQWHGYLERGVWRKV